VQRFLGFRFMSLWLLSRAAE